VHFRRDDGDYRQAEITTELAREAYAKGADWVIPIDADEFWYAPGGNLRSVLEQSRVAGIKVGVTNFIQQRAQLVAEPGGLLQMTHRTPVPAGFLKWIRDLVESRDFSYVEVTFPSKWISRASESSEITMGNHDLGKPSASVEFTDEIVCLHAPLRSRSILDSKVEQGRRVAALGLDKTYGWHVQRWSRIAEEGELEKEWAANSYADETLDVYGALHALVYDPRLRDLVRPWVKAEAGETRQSGMAATARTPLVPVAGAANQLPDSVDGLTRQLRSLRQERQDLLRTIQLQLSSVPLERERAVKKLSDAVALRDRTILDLGNELHSKVGERDGTIRRLQQEINEKVTAANQRIQALKAEMEEEVGERDDAIGALQRELQEKVTAANQTIQALKAEVEKKVGERDDAIGALQRELQEKVTAANQTIQALKAEMEEKVGERDDAIGALQRELHEKVTAANQTIQALKAEMEEKLGEANRLMYETVAERDVTISSLEKQLASVASKSEHMLNSLRAEKDNDRAEQDQERTRHGRERVEQERNITALYKELRHIKESKTWRLLAVCRKIRRKLS
jgi:hypothetical protein